MSGIREYKENLLIRARAQKDGYSRVVKRGRKGMRHLEFGLLRLSSGTRSAKTGESEQVIVVYAGTAEMDFEGALIEVNRDIPIVLLPPNTRYSLRVTQSPFDCGIFSAPLASSERGVLGPAEDAITGERLIVSHVLIPEKPVSEPHKHDAFNPPNEFPHEEVCHFRITPAKGRALVRVFTGPVDPCPMNESYEVADGDTVIIPRGFHTISAALGSMVWCTSVLAGEVYPPRIRHTPA